MMPLLERGRGVAAPRGAWDAAPRSRPADGDARAVASRNRLLLGRRGRALFGGEVGQHLSDGDDALAGLGDVVGRATLFGDVLGDGHGIDHVDGVPRAPALAQGAADAALEVDIDERLQTGLVLARHLVDAIDGADLDTGLAPGAVVRPDDG